MKEELEREFEVWVSFHSQHEYCALYTNTGYTNLTNLTDNINGTEHHCQVLRKHRGKQAWIYCTRGMIRTQECLGASTDVSGEELWKILEEELL